MLQMGSRSVLLLCWLLFFGFAPGSWVRSAPVGADPGNTPMVTDLNKLAVPGRYRATIKSGDYWRKFIFVTPKKFKVGEPLPIVFFFHGAGGTSEQAFLTYGWAQKADTESFFAVFPEGLGAKPTKPGNFALNPNVWRDGRASMPGQDVDDVQFFEDLLTKLQFCVAIDPKRIFITGFSNGAGMTFTLGARFSDRIAAIAPVSSQSFVQTDTLLRPVPLYFLASTADPLVPYRGGTVTLPWGSVVTHPPVQESLDQWLHLDKCAAQPQTLHDANGVLTVSYGSDPKHTEILFTTIESNGHHWPGTVEPLPESIAGPSRDPFHATDAIWDFFKAHPIKGEKD